MKSSVIASVIALASTAIALPAVHGGGKCISQSEANDWVERFIGVLGQTDPRAGDTADQIIAEGFVEYSNSILSLQGKPLNTDGIAAHSKAEWTNGVLHAPQTKGITTKQILVACDTIIWYWDFKGVGTAQYPAKGINLFHMKRSGHQLQCDRLDLEFDSIAWGLDTGLKVTLRDGTTLP